MPESFIDWLSIDFVQQAMLMSFLLAIPAALLSCFLVLRGWALMGDAISHAVLPGVVLAYLFGAPLVIGAFIAGLLCALATGYLADNCRVKQDTVMGVVFSGMFGIGIVLFSMTETDLHLDHILFGDILGLTWSDVLQTGLIAIFASVILLLQRKDLLVVAFDRKHAHSIGLPVTVLHYGLLILLAVTIVAGLKAVGIILVIALLIAPGAIGHLLCDRFGTMLATSVLAAVSAAVLGVSLSLYLDSAPAPTIVVVLSAMAVLAMLAAGFRNRSRSRIKENTPGSIPAPVAAVNDSNHTA